MIEIRTVKQHDSPKVFQEFMSELIDEDVYIRMDKKPTLKEQKEWLEGMKKKIRAKQVVWLCAWHGKKQIATVRAEKGLWNERNNVDIGISVLKKYRGKGLGEKLLRDILRLAREKLKPKNIYLSVAAPNKPAINLYKKLGFRIFAKFPNWAHKGKRFFDVYYMILKK